MTISTVTRDTLSVDTALSFIAKAFEVAKTEGIQISVAVCGPSMELLAFAKGDQATPHSAETSRRKAQTAASTKKPTGWMNDSLALTLPMGSGNLLTNIPGGAPIIIDGVCVGGVGIAGGTVEQDQKIIDILLNIKEDK